MQWSASRKNGKHFNDFYELVDSIHRMTGIDEELENVVRLMERTDESNIEQPEIINTFSELKSENVLILFCFIL